MDNKNDIFDDIEIIDDDFEQTPPKKDELIQEDWLSDFTNAETINTEEVIDVEVMDEPTAEVNNTETIIEEEPIIEEATEILNNIEITDPNSNVNFQTAPVEVSEQTDEIDEEELDNNRSVMFITILFGLLILFVLLLPTITKILG